jgi:hypothetical protein
MRQFNQSDDRNGNILTRNTRRNIRQSLPGILALPLRPNQHTGVEN